MALSFRNQFDNVFDTINKMDYEMMRMIPRLPGLQSPSFDLDFYETENSYVLNADIPGIDKENVKINLDNGYLVISAERSDSKEISDKGKNKYYFSERTFGSFTRTVRIPGNADCEQINASYNNGVLSVTLNKKQDISQIKNITIN